MKIPISVVYNNANIIRGSGKPSRSVRDQGRIKFGQHCGHQIGVVPDTADTVTRRVEKAVVMRLEKNANNASKRIETIYDSSSSMK